MAFPCLVCSSSIRPRQDALSCNSCFRKQHRICASGINRDDYRRMIRNGTLNFKCNDCKDGNFSTNPDAESTRLDTEETIPYQEASSLQVTRVEFETPTYPQEDSIIDEAPSCVSEAEAEITYSVMEGTSQRGKRKLVSSDGFTYVMKRQNKDSSVVWRCSVRNKVQTCPVLVHQRQDVFSSNSQHHTHPSQPGIHTAMVIKKKVCDQATKELFVPAPTIVDQIFQEYADSREPEHARPNPTQLARTANRRRQLSKPDNPTDLSFKVAEDFITEHTEAKFYRGDVTTGTKRHLLFATDHQLQLLSNAKTWYIDGTFKIVSRPFYQLLSIHTFVRSGEDMKQLPGIFVLMSGKRKRDYKKVFKAILDLLPTTIALKEVVSDFEEGLWRAIHKVFTDVPVHGCSFHWCQAVWRHVQELGLQCDYNQRDSVHKFIRKLLALPFLPTEQITPTFTKMKESTTSERILQLLRYIDNTWISNGIWSPATWSVFRRTIRTNNDVEGYHYRINRRAMKPSLPFYTLVLLLHQEAILLPTQMKMVSEGKLRRYQRKSTKTLQGKIFKIWDDYQAERISTNQLLRKCSKMYSPVL